ncbi:hypothetical protein [Paenibacillus gansuensis]|uniref:Uncharacterized protein n=1 Tax=Paenibacillus gansuensis TaxID=306542 RepID=A0ABW5PAT4_9BACL
MKKAAVSLLLVCVLIVSAGLGMLWYVRPEQPLDLEYKPLAIENKVLEMISSRKLETAFTEEELNQALKEWLAANNFLSEHWEITGAQGRLNGERMDVDVNVLYAGRVPVGATAVYRLTWDNPNLIAEPVEVQVKRAKVTAAQAGLQPVVIPIGDQLPLGFSISKVTFEAKSVRVKFRFSLL